MHVERAEGADACPDAAAFAKRMREAGDLPDLGTRSIEVRFERSDAGLRSSVRMPDGSRRSFTDDGPSCDGLADATALAVRLALDLAPAPAPASAPRVAAASAPEADDAPEPPPPRARRASSAEVSASGALVFGLASPTAAGVRAGGAFVFGDERWSLGITGLALPPRTQAVGDGTVRVSVLGGGLEGCRRAPLGRSVMLAVCGRVEAMRLAGRAEGFARSEERARPLFAGTLLGRARARVAGPLAVFVEAGAVVPFVRERFAIDQVGVVYDPPVVAGATGIGALVDFE